MLGATGRESFTRISQGICVALAVCVWGSVKESLLGRGSAMSLLFSPQTLYAILIGGLAGQVYALLAGARESSRWWRVGSLMLAVGSATMTVAVLDVREPGFAWWHLLVAGFMGALIGLGIGVQAERIIR